MTSPRLLLGSRFLFSIALAFAGASGCGGASSEAADASGAKAGLVGSPAPSFVAEPVAGSGPKTLEEAKGEVVILDFWATFCEPCKKSFPKYQELADQFGGQVVVLAVSVDEAEITKKEALLDFVKNTGVKFGVVWDKDQSIVKKYGPPKMPTSYIIDKAGTVRFIHAGYETGEEVKIAEEIKGLLK